jgi:hypothetical protein
VNARPTDSCTSPIETFPMTHFRYNSIAFTRRYTVLRSASVAGVRLVDVEINDHDPSVVRIDIFAVSPVQSGLSSFPPRAPGG